VVAFRDDSNGTMQRLPDPEWERLNDLEQRVRELREQLLHMEEHLDRVHRALHPGEPEQVSG
jgi:hypothetical protein